MMNAKPATENEHSARSRIAIISLSTLLGREAVTQFGSRLAAAQHDVYVFCPPAPTLPQYEIVEGVVYVRKSWISRGRLDALSNRLRLKRITRIPATRTIISAIRALICAISYGPFIYKYRPTIIYLSDTISLSASPLLERITKAKIVSWRDAAIQYAGTDPNTSLAEPSSSTSRHSLVPRKTFQPPPDMHILYAESDCAILCNSYPGGKRLYGGEFIRTRVDAYVKAGIRVLVVEISNSSTEPALSTHEGVHVYRAPPRLTHSIILGLSRRNFPVLAHSPTPDIQYLLQNTVKNERLVYWFHGYEVRDYRRLLFNYSTAELAMARQQLDAANRSRLAASQRCLQRAAIRKVFVSDFLRHIAEVDAGITSLNSHIIPNFIDGDLFTAITKTASQAVDLLLIRSFERRNFANDIAIEAIHILSKREDFSRFRITVRGFGKQFHELTSSLSKYTNVDVLEKYSSPTEMAALYSTHGVFLCPSRFDTQGVTMCEAMASGLVCISNRVAGIPEFLDDSCGVLVRSDDPRAFAEGIGELVDNPERMPTLSRAAANRVRELCGYGATIHRELELCGFASPVSVPPNRDASPALTITQDLPGL